MNPSCFCNPATRVSRVCLSLGASSDQQSTEVNTSARTAKTDTRFMVCFYTSGCGMEVVLRWQKPWPCRSIMPLIEDSASDSYGTAENQDEEKAGSAGHHRSRGRTRQR